MLSLPLKKRRPDEADTADQDTLPMATVPAASAPGFAADAPRTYRVTRRKLIGIGAAVVVLAGAGVGIGLAVSGGGSGTASPVTFTNQNVTVSTATMKQTVSASGSLEPAQDSDLTFAVSGTVTAVNVKTGDKVTEGQALATIDSTALADDVAAAQASLTSAQDRLTTDQDDSASTSQVDSDQASVTSAESQLTTAEENLADATLKATFTGTVASVDLAVGDIVSGSASSSGSGESTGSGVTGNGGSSTGAGASTAATSSSSTTSSSGDGITVISDNSFTVSTTVDSTEVGQVKPGDQAVITPSGSSMTVYGTVASVSLIASSSSSSVASFPVVVDVTGSPTGLYAGASASVSIVVKQLNDVVQVPTAALSYADGKATVTKVVNGSHVTQAVTTGVSLNSETQITSGLKAGDVIVERVAKFNGTAGSGRSLFGGASGGTGSRTGGTGGLPGGGGFPAGGAGFSGSGAGAPGSGS